MFAFGCADPPEADSSVPDAPLVDAAAVSDGKKADAPATVTDGPSAPDTGADGSLLADAGPTAGCNPKTGAGVPLAVCSSTLPCVRTGARSPIVTPSKIPLCQTSLASGRPLFDDGPPL